MIETIDEMVNQLLKAGTSYYRDTIHAGPISFESKDEYELLDDEFDETHVEQWAPGFTPSHSFA